MNYWLHQQVELGDSSALTILTTHYERGIGTEVDEGKAFRLIQSFCRNYPNNAEGKTKLALAFMDGTGVQRDVERGLVILREAAQ